MEDDTANDMIEKITEFKEFVEKQSHTFDEKTRHILESMSAQFQIIEEDFLLIFNRYNEAKITFDADCDDENYSEEMISHHGKVYADNTDLMLIKAISLTDKSIQALIETLKETGRDKYLDDAEKTAAKFEQQEEAEIIQEQDRDESFDNLLEEVEEEDDKPKEQEAEEDVQEMQSATDEEKDNQGRGG